MHKGRLLVFGMMATILVVSLLISFLPKPGEQGSLPQSTRTDNSPNLGITYLTVNSDVASYYGLAASSGSLITEVSPDSLMAKGGVKKGDIIISYNGTRLGQGVSLLSLLRNCPVGKMITMEILRGKENITLSFLHTVK